MLLTWTLFCAFCVICLALLLSPEENRHHLAFPHFVCLNNITENLYHFTTSSPNSGPLLCESELHSQWMKCVTSENTGSFLRPVIVKRARIFCHWASWTLTLLGEDIIDFWRQNFLVDFGSWHPLRRLRLRQYPQALWASSPSSLMFPTKGNHHPEICVHYALSFLNIIISLICILEKCFYLFLAQ